MFSAAHARQAFLIALLVFLPCAICEAANRAVEFSWAVLQDTLDGQQAIDFLHPEPVRNRATLQIFLKQQPGVYIYLYLLDSSGELELLFPKEPTSYDETGPVEKTIRIPPGGKRFTLTPPAGQERLFLMAASMRLKRLEQLTKAYLNQPTDKKRGAAVIQEMKKLRHRYSKLTQTTETGVPIAGTVRSIQERGAAFTVTRVKAETFYSRILRIRHE